MKFYPAVFHKYYNAKGATHWARLAKAVGWVTPCAQQYKVVTIAILSIT